MSETPHVYNGSDSVIIRQQPRISVSILTYPDGTTMITDNLVIALREESLSLNKASLHTTMMSQDQWKSALQRFTEEIEAYG